VTTPLYLKPGVIRNTLGRKEWSTAIPFGPEGFRFDKLTSDKRPMSRVIVTVAPAADNSGSQEWVHASISHADHMPTYEDLTMLHRAVWGTDGWAYQCFAPADDHVNISQYVLHLWGLPDGRPALPNFGAAGTI
jgi:hypothetical protein